MRALVADGLTLEPLVRAHAAEMFDVLSDPALYAFDGAPPESVEQLFARYACLESRSSPEGMALWLNWVLRLPDGALAGYVQATVLPTDVCFVAYVLGSAHWRRGLASAAVRAMLVELRTHYGVRRFVAVLKEANHRSHALLNRLGFTPADSVERALYSSLSDELVMAVDAGPAG